MNKEINHFFVEHYTDGPDTSSGPKDVSQYREDRINSIMTDTIIQPRWISADVWEKESDGDSVFYDVIYEKSFYHGRNYWLFNYLSDVRYGPDWLDGPLDQPRGVPDDASDSYKWVVNRW